jgi:hypothetical protein
MNDVKFGLWSVPGSPVLIHYSQVVIEEIRHEVSTGFQKMARGGIEVGGVLYGREAAGAVNILAMRPISCEHALGPSFQLSERDRAQLAAQLEAAVHDPQLEGLCAVGFYVSHTRSDIALTHADLEIFQTYFPEPFQVALVIRPGRAGAMRAGFFVRERSGSITAERSQLEFNFPDRLAGVLDRPRSERPLGERRAPAALPPASPMSGYAGGSSGYGGAAAAATALALTEPTRTYDPRIAMADLAVPRQPRKARWPWVTAWALGVAMLAYGGWHYFAAGTGAEPIGLSVIERDGQLQISWNHSAHPVATAARGILDIADGSDRRPITLSTADLARGNFTYQRRSGDVEVRMIVEDLSGTKTQEASRFLGRPPGQAGADQSQMEATRDQMESDNARLRRDNEKQAKRIQQLERTLKILQTRLGAPVDDGAPPQ